MAKVQISIIHPAYLDSRNIDFVGYSREQYERTKALPEGSYRISFTAYDYRRQDVQVSNEGSSFYYLSKNDPPLINLPVCGAKVPVRQPQQVIFSWLPRNTSSPASAGETQYEFSLYEIRPEGRNPNDVVLSSQPVFKTTIDYTQLVYGPAEPQLTENMRYAWRVRAIDAQGRDAFRNNGYSEVCTFTYGGVDPAFIVGGIAGLQAEGESERSARIWWEKGNFDSYRIYYKKSGQGHEWFTSDLLAHDLDPAKEEGELKLFDLEPDTEYETRAQAKKMGTPGPYTAVDLSTYGLERTRLNHSIDLDDAASTLDPQNPNPRGAHGGDEEKDQLDEIIRTFNERWFHGWDATPEDQRVKFLTLSKHIQAHPDYQSKVADNNDTQNRELAFKKILDDVMSQQRKKELELYKLYAKDDSFYQAFFDTMKRMIDNPQIGRRL